MSDPFAVLFVSPHAPRAVIDAAYKALAKQYHPDANPGMPPAFMARLNAAYEELCDENRRQLHWQRRWQDEQRRRVPPAADVVMDFGKHRGMRLGELPSDYLEWMVRNLTRQTNLREDARAVLAWRRGMP